MEKTEQQKPASRKGIYDWVEALRLVIFGFLVPNGYCAAPQFKTRRSNIPCLTEDRIGETIQASTRVLTSFYNELVKQLERRLAALNVVLEANTKVLEEIKSLPWYKALKPSNHRRLVEINAKILGIQGEIAGINVALLDLHNVRPVESALRAIVDREAQAKIERINHTPESQNSPLIKG